MSVFLSPYPSVCLSFPYVSQHHPPLHRWEIILSPIDFISPSFSRCPPGMGRFLSPPYPIEWRSCPSDGSGTIGLTGIGVLESVPDLVWSITPDPSPAPSRPSRMFHAIGGGVVSSQKGVEEHPQVRMSALRHGKALRKGHTIGGCKACRVCQS